MSADPKAATLTARQDDYRAAARRHMFDAAVLKGQQRYDGAAYLAGYVVECSLKTLIEMESGPVKPVHDLARLRDAISDLSRQADARTARFAGVVADVLQHAAILAWEPQMRYRASAVGADQAKQWTTEAQAVYSAVIGGLFLDGALR